MHLSEYFIPTLKETPIGTEAVSHQLSLRAGLVHMLTSGVYSYLPLGLRVLKKIEGIIREEMDAIGCHELLLPALQPLDIWKKTGRDQALKEVMIAFDDKKGRRMCLGPTHEEVITVIARDFIQSYRQLPVTLYQIQSKFRDEIRTRFGIVRACEFIMKDAYSFDRDQAGLKKNYDLQLGAYRKIFKRCGLEVMVVTADSGAMGGSVSHEFLVPAPVGEDAVWMSADGKAVKAQANDQPPAGGSWEKKVAMELGHIFQLGTKYSEALGAVYLDDDGKQKPMVMGCYGIGVSRLLAAIIELNHDAQGILWPQGVAPFDVAILSLQADTEALSLAKAYHDDLQKQGLQVLWDNRDESAGRKFNDADLVGVPYQVLIGKKGLSRGEVEIKDRRTKTVTAVNKNTLPSEIFKRCR